MSSIRRILASRANGARSKGPKTAEGKKRVAANAICHGLLANQVVLENESPEVFQALVCAYTSRLAPVDALEAGLVEEMASAYWRLRRGWSIETSLLNTALGNQPFAGDKKGEIARSAAAFRHLAASPELPLLHRYETRLHNMFQRAMYNLLLLRDLDLPNKPSPIFGHPDDTTLEAPPSPAPDVELLPGSLRPPKRLAPTVE